MRHLRFALALLTLLPGVLSGGVFGSARQVRAVNAAAMAVDLEGDRLYVAAGTALSVFDVSRPLEPQLLGSFEGVDNRRQLVVRNGFAYLVSRETGLRIIDCTDPHRPRLRARFDSVEFATGIEVVGKTAFLSERINGVEVVDVSDPDAPAHVAIHKTAESQSCRYWNGYLYSGEWGAGEVSVFDLRDIRKVGSVPLQGFGDGLDISNGHLYCSTGHDAKHNAKTGDAAVGAGRGLDIFALDDPARPRHVGRVDFPRFKPRNDDYWTVRVSGRTVFCADSHNGLFAVDVGDPSAPRVVDRFCVPDAAHPTWPSAAVSSLAVGHGCLYVTVAQGGLFVVSVDGVSPVPVAKGREPCGVGSRADYPTDSREFSVYRPERSGQARTAAVRGDVVYAAFGDAGLQVLRVGADGGLLKLGALAGRKVYDCCWMGDRLLTAEGTDGFALYRIACEAKFEELARRPRLSAAETVACWVWAYPGDLAVLSGRNGPLHFVGMDRDGVFGGARAEFRFSCQWDKYLADCPLGGRLPVVQPGRSLVWLDLSGAKPVEKGRDTTLKPRQTNGVCRFGDSHFLVTEGRGYAFVTPDGARTGEQGMFPQLDDAMRGGGVPRSDGRFVALTARSAKCAALYDFGDRRQPKKVRFWNLSGNPDAAAFCNGRVVIPAGHQGLLVSRENFNNY